MIWACDSHGRTTYVSPEWLTLTGQSRKDAESWGWLDAVHPEDREIVHSVLVSAAQSAVDFSATFRVRTRAGPYLWVRGGAMPSFSPQDGRFIGFLGSVAEVPALPSNQAASSLGDYRPPPPTPLTRPHSVLELIADHLLMARALAAEAQEEMLRSILDMGLLEAGQRLAASQLKGEAVSPK
jgi:PAS domain S-box-containing protein